MAPFSKMKSSYNAPISIKIATAYFLVGALWILFSDKMLEVLVHDPTVMTEISMTKGWAFILITACMLYVLLDRWTSRLARSQQEARLIDAKYREIVESANSIIFRMDNAGRVTYLNDFAQRFFGCSAIEVTGRNVFETIFPPVDTDGRDLRSMIEDVPHNQDAYHSSITENILRSGEKVWIAWTFQPVFDDNGQVGETLCVGNNITERKKAEEALRESEEKFSVAFRRGPAMSIITAVEDGTFIDVNDRFLEVSGYTREELFRMNSLDILWNRHEDRLHFVESLLRRGKISGREITFRNKAGEPVYGLANTEVVTIGGVRRILTMVLDITKRKQAEHALKESESRLKTIFQTTNEGIWVIDTQAVIMEINPRMRAILGRNREEIIGRKIFDFVDDENKAVFERQVKIRAKGEAGSYEIALSAPSGAPVFCRCNAVPLLDGSGNKIGSFAMVTDITEQKRAKDSLSESEAKFRSYIEHSPLAVFVSDREGRLVDFNPSAVKLLGYEEAALAGKNILELHPDEEREKVLQDFATLLEKGRVEGEYRLKRRDGYLIWVSLHAVVVSDRVTLAYIRDITEQKRDEGERELTIEFLRLMQETDNKKEMIAASLAFFGERSGCEAIGIRLKEGDDYPYFETRGFPPGFVQAQSSLCGSGEASEMPGNSLGNPVVAGMCASVIRGRSDSSQPFFTENGSFWTNSTTQLPTNTMEAGPQAGTDNRCNGEGYESVALLPLNAGTHGLGLLQLNDRRKGRFTPEDIAMWERLAGYLAVALAKFDSEEKLRESEEQFQTIFETASIGMAQTDPVTGRWVRVNRKMCEISGYSSSEMLAMSFRDITHPEDRERDWTAFQNVVESKSKAYRLEKRYIRKDGEIIWVNVNMIVIHDRDGRPVRAFATIEDITERKRTEQRLREYENVVEGLDEMIVVVDRDYRYLIANSMFLKYRGMEADQVLGHSVAEVIDEEVFKKEVEKNLEECFRGNVITFELKYYYEQLGDRDLLISYFPIEGHAGVDRAACILQDITDMKRAEELLSRQEMMLKEAAEIAHVGGWEFDPATLEGSWTEQTARIYDVDPAVKPHVQFGLNFYSGESRGRMETAVKEAIELAKPYDLEVELVSAKGARKWVRTICHPIVQDGRVVRMRGSIQDITERRQVEAALRKSLDEKVALLKEVHHRVKNNLQIVASLLGLQAGRSGNRKVVDVLQDTRSRVRSMALLHETLYRSGNLARINFASYLKDLCGQLLLSSGPVSGRVKMEYRVSQIALPLEHALPCGLIVNELVSNALKHGFPGRRTGSIFVEFNQAQARKLVLRVRDDGAGLPSGFDPAGTSTLGVQLVCGLASQLGGQLEVEARQEAGAAFRVVFPVPEDSLFEGES